LFVLDGGLLVDETFEVGEAFGIKAALGDGKADRTTRLAIVLAVPEAALIHQLEDVAERPFDPVSRQPQRECPDAGRVDEPAAVIGDPQ
jgi:hypothetical protein